MVHLNKIYTRTGDDGSTGLGDGSRVEKRNQRIRACGSIDELNCALGVVRTLPLPSELDQQLQQIQNSLFDLGADLCVPLDAQTAGFEPLRITEERTAELEQWIDATNENLKPLTSFILPGGNPLAAHIHLARAVCRRAEIDVVSLAGEAELNPALTMYLNRLSDFLFVLARDANNHGRDDVLWQPGR